MVHVVACLRVRVYTQVLELLNVRIVHNLTADQPAEQTPPWLFGCSLLIFLHLTEGGIAENSHLLGDNGRAQSGRGVVMRHHFLTVSGRGTRNRIENTYRFATTNSLFHTKYIAYYKSQES
jgi:hypothetical protein